MIKKALVLSAVSLSLMSTAALAQNLAVVNGLEKIASTEI